MSKYWTEVEPYLKSELSQGEAKKTNDWIVSAAERVGDGNNYDNSIEETVKYLRDTVPTDKLGSEVETALAKLEQSRIQLATVLAQLQPGSGVLKVPSWHVVKELPLSDKVKLPVGTELLFPLKRKVYAEVGEISYQLFLVLTHYYHRLHQVEIIVKLTGNLVIEKLKQTEAVFNLNQIRQTLYSIEVNKDNLFRSTTNPELDQLIQQDVKDILTLITPYNPSW